MSDDRDRDARGNGVLLWRDPRDADKLPLIRREQRFRVRARSENGRHVHEEAIEAQLIVSSDFVFVHVPKTGGTFLREAIEASCQVIDLGHAPHCPYSELPQAYRHLPAIGFVRDPWDWYVSWWTHHRRIGRQSLNTWHYREFEIARGDFAHSLRLAFSKPEFREVDYYSSVVQRFLDGVEVGRVETLRSDFLDFLDGHGIEARSLAAAVRARPPVNVGDHGPSARWYDDETRALVGRSFVARVYGYCDEPESDPSRRFTTAVRSQLASV